MEGLVQQADELAGGGAVLDIVDLGKARVGDVMIDTEAWLIPHPLPLFPGAARVGAVHGHEGLRVHVRVPRQHLLGAGQKGIEMGHGIVAYDLRPLAQLFEQLLQGQAGPEGVPVGGHVGDQKKVGMGLDKGDGFIQHRACSPRPDSAC